jgi:hypothetical protein
MGQIITVVNACNILKDDDVRATIPAFQKQIDRDFMPAWGHLVPAVKLTFVPASIILTTPGKGWPLDPHCWPIFLNRHSTDDALGWHTDDVTQNFPIHGRCFIGDCMHAGLSWTVTLSHEILEIIVDPKATKVFRMPAIGRQRTDRFAAVESADAVEADEQASTIDKVKVSNWVYPDYFSRKIGVRYDFGGHLKGPCPSLTSGGYMSIMTNGRWGQIQMDRKDGLAGRRATIVPSFRSMKRATTSLVEEIVG